MKEASGRLPRRLAHLELWDDMIILKVVTECILDFCLYVDRTSSKFETKTTRSRRCKAVDGSGCIVYKDTVKLCASYELRLRHPLLDKPGAKSNIHTVTSAALPGKQVQSDFHHRRLATLAQAISAFVVFLHRNDLKER